MFSHEMRSSTRIINLHKESLGMNPNPAKIQNITSSYVLKTADKEKLLHEQHGMCLTEKEQLLTSSLKNIDPKIESFAYSKI